jgi:DNA repair ATPase RecN
VQSLAGTLGTVAKDLGEAHFALTSISKSDGVWEGKASEAFHGKLGELPGYLDKANRSLGDASNALHGWVTDLSSMQRTAGDYERQAAQALQVVEKAKANPDLGLAGQFFDDEQAFRQAQSRLDAAKSQLTSAMGELEVIRGAARRLLQQHADLADQVADALRRAKDEAPEEPGLFDRIGEMFGDLIDGIKEHADVIAKIGEVLSKIGNVLSIGAIATSWIPASTL